MRDEAWVVLVSVLMVTTAAPVALAGSSGQASSAPIPAVEAGPFGPTGPGEPGGGPPASPAQGEDLQETLLVPTMSGTNDEPGDQRAWFGWSDVSKTGRVAVAGSASNQPWVGVFEADGELAWSRTIETGMDKGYPEGIAFGPDGSVYVAELGRSWGPSAAESGLHKFGPDGELLWEHAFDQPDPTVLRFLRGVAVGPNGEVAVTGLIADEGQSIDDYEAEFRVDTFHENGTHRWTASSSRLQYQMGNKLVFDAAGNLHVAGFGGDGFGADGQEDPIYWQFGPDGQELDNLYLGEDGPEERFNAIGLHPSGSVVLGGLRAHGYWGASVNALVAEINPLGTVDHVTEVDTSVSSYWSVGVKASGTVVASGEGQVDALDGDGNLLWSTRDALPDVEGERIGTTQLGPADRIHVTGNVDTGDAGTDAFVASLADAYSPVAQAEQALAPGPLG